jgi:hypothetical protein
VRTGFAPGSAGTYAIVIGISKYLNLQDNAAAYGLGNLFVSARTAADFFDWLTTSYDSADAPLQRCSLLLSPTADEQAYLAGLKVPLRAADYDLPTMANLQTAINDWFASMKMVLSEQAAAQSRAIIFYSGHGLEVDKDKQLLLPFDYLTDAAPSYNSAVSTYNLHSALGSLPIRRQLFFIDACRNDVQTFREMTSWDGMPILNEFRGQKSRQAPILYASAPGASAWQPKTLAEGGSFYGQALLDALRMTTTPARPFTPVCNADFETVELFSLYQYIAERVQAKLQLQEINQLDPICLGGIVRENTAVTRRAAGPNEAKAAAPSADTHDGAAQNGGTAPRDASAAAGASFTMSSGTLADPVIQRRLTELVFEKPFDGMRLADAAQKRIAEVFGDIEVASFFSGLKISRYVDRKWCAAPTEIEISFVERSHKADLVCVTFAFANPTWWHWLQGESSLATFATLLPPTDTAVFYRVVVARNVTEVQQAASPQPNDGVNITTVQISLSDRNVGIVGEAASDYSLYRLSPLLPEDRLHDIAQRGRSCSAIAIDRDSPQRHDAALAAILAAMILMRNGRDDLFGTPGDESNETDDWLEALVAKSRYSSDAAILATQRMMQNPCTFFNLNDVGRQLRIIVENGTPFSSEVFAYGVKQLQNLFGSFDETAPMLSKLGVEAFGKRILELAKGYRRGGFFTTFGAPGLTLDEADGLASVRPLT